MQTGRFVMAAALVSLLTGCSGVESVTRSTALPGLIGGNPEEGVASVLMAPAYAVQAVSVSVPRRLKVSEANLYFPVADIVWRADPRGDRYAQVQAVFDAAMAMGTAAMTAGPAVTLDIEVTRFHALTEKARYTIGGSYSMRFLLTVRDAATGAIIDGPRPVNADTHAAGGDLALAEEAQGLTQKVVVTQRLAEVIAAELTRPVAVPAAQPVLMSALAAPAN